MNRALGDLVGVDVGWRGQADWVAEFFVANGRHIEDGWARHVKKRKLLRLARRAAGVAITR